MTQYEVIHHCGTGYQFDVEAESREEAVELAREMWVRCEGELLYDDIDRVEVRVVAPLATTVS